MRHCARCGKQIIRTASMFCVDCLLAMQAKADNNTELEERVEAWQKKNLRR